MTFILEKATIMPIVLPQVSANIGMCHLDPSQTSSLSLGIMTVMTPHVTQLTQMLKAVIPASISEEEVKCAVGIPLTV